MSSKPSATKATQTKEVKFTEPVVEEPVNELEPIKELSAAEHFRNLLQGLDIKSSTALSYTRSFLILTEDIGLDLDKDSQKTILEKVEASKYASSTKSKLLGLAHLYRKSRGLKNGGVLIKKDKLEKARRYVDPGHDLPSLKDLLEHSEKKFVDKDWTGYLVTQLLLTLCSRNQDLDLLVTNNKELAANGNTLFVDEEKQRLIVTRRMYKTHKTYGTKRTVLKSKKLYHAASSLVGEHHARHLLQTLSGQRVTAVASAIQRHTYKGYTESVYCKTQVSAVKEVKDLHKLVAMSKARGTQVATLIDYYHEDLRKPIFGKQ